MGEREIVAILKSVGVDAEPGQIERPPQPEFGEASFPCFHLAKAFRKSPVQIAEELAQKIKLPRGSLVRKVEARGGYLNFHYDYEKFSKAVLSEVKKRIVIGRKRRVMVEYSSPNPVHPMHVGGSRNTFLGDAFANALEFTGHKVIRANYINNVGLQVAKLVAAYMMWGDGKMPEGKPDLWLWKFYVRFHEEAKSDPRLEERAKELLRDYELRGNKSVRKVWDRVVGWCVDGFRETYERSGVEFDDYFYESDFRAPGKRVVQKALKRHVASMTDDGAVFADMSSAGIPGTIIQRSDGTGLYITSDLGLTEHKFRKFRLDESVWVSAAPQELHFQQLFKILELTGHSFAKKCKHLSYEVVSLADGKMSSREGRAVMLDEVLDRLTNLAHGEVDKRNPDMPGGKKRKIAGQIATGALKYAIVRIEPHSQIVFDWDQMLSLEGNTGPYLQYAHTRCLGIMRKAGKFSPVASYPDTNDQERALIRKLSEFQRVASDAARDMRPHMVCNYGYELATAFNSFYQHSPVLQLEDKRQTAFRLTLVRSVMETLEKVFEIVGMEAPEKM